MADTEILFPEPCHEDWEQMHPDGRARLCDVCDKQVHDLSRYTPEEADILLLGSETPACIRVTILPDGRVATLPGRAGKVLMAAIATPALMFATAGAATGPHTGAIVGSVSTAGAPVRVTVETGTLRRSTRVDNHGAYRFDGLPPGEYKLVFSAASARRWTISRVAVRASHVTVRNSYDPQLPTMVISGVVPPSPPPPAHEPVAKMRKPASG
ncbi:MAG: carboxypeptidase-like regulatory domain-containing protein [Sphingomonas sp.]